MENYHLFVVDEKSFKFHLEYGFIGTGSRSINFNIGLWEDIVRLKVGDKIIFYVQKIKKFYGIFQVSSLPFFDIGNPPYLQNAPLNIINNNQQNIYLKYRALIETYRAFPKGIDEFDLVDILPPNTKEILWSILYRKLKGERGNSPLFKIEYKTIQHKLRNFNNNISLNSNNLTYQNGVISSGGGLQYNGDKRTNVDIRNDILGGNYNEHYLHSLLLEHLPQQIFGTDIDWIGNEVYSGAGMQAIDLLSIHKFEEEKIFNIIEVKKTKIPNNITTQICKYISWLKHRFINHNTHNYQPILLGAEIKRNTKMMHRRIKEFNSFNDLNISKPIKYFEYRIYNNNLYIDELKYNHNTLTIINTIQI